MPLAIAHPFTERELARIVRDCYRYAIDHRGVRRVLEWHQLSPDVLQSRRHQAQQIPFPALPPDQQRALPFEPSTLAGRLAQALGPEHLLLRFRTYGEYPTEEQARWRIIELLGRRQGFWPKTHTCLHAPKIEPFARRPFTKLEVSKHPNPYGSLIGFARGYTRASTRGLVNTLLP